MNSVRRAVVLLVVSSIASLVAISGSQAAPRAAAAGTKTITVVRGGKTYQHTVDVTAQVDGQTVLPGSVIVRFKDGVTAAGKSDAHRAAAAIAAHALKLDRAERLEVPPGQEKHAVDVLSKRSDVEYAQLDEMMKADEVPSDTYFPQLWGMTKIRAPQAWDVTHASTAVKIAVLDCGIFDTASQYQGPDGYGHIDVRSKVVADANFSSSTDTDDWCNHGTHVAGTAAAVTNNALGVAGVGHDAALMNGKVLGDDGSGPESGVINGLIWAANNGAHVINMSLGSAAACSQGLQDAVNYAWNHGAVVVVAAGNTGSYPPSNLTRCNNTLSVAATDANDVRASFSSWGTQIDVAAPGVGIWSSTDDGLYDSFQGTSMASPHVAGLAALVWTTGSQDNADVVNRIESSAVKISGTGTYFKYGRVDALAAMTAGPSAGPRNSAANPSVDFDGDGLTDLGALYRGLSPADSLWYASSSTGGSPFQIFFGATSDVPVPGDYDGDGKTDAVIFRPSTGLWYGPRTGAASIVIQTTVGQAGDIPIAGDYDGDGKTDPAIYRPSTGMFFAVLSGGGTKSSTFGAPGDTPVPRDYDGDGKTDFAIYRPRDTNLSLWYAVLSAGGTYQIYFGVRDDIPVPADYNGDKKAEAVIYRPTNGLWYGPLNGGGGLFQLQLGQAGDVPIPGYYDADPSQDPAIYRPTTGLWFTALSGGGTKRIDGLGNATDVAVQKRPSLAGGL
jgi:thermitase